MIAYIVRRSIRHAGIVVTVASALVVYGFYVLTRANLDVFPEFSPSQVVIQTEAPGFSSELVERQVTQPIESALAGVSGLEALRSQSIGGLSVVTIAFREGTNAYRNRQIVGERLALVATQLPAGVGPAKITPLTSSASTVLGLGLTSERRSLMELRTLVDWTVRPHLLAVKGVADVNVFGGQVRQWQIQVEPERLARYGLSIQDVVQAARGASGVIAAGFVQGANQQIAITAEGQPGSVSELGRTMLAYRDGRVLTLADVAKVVEGSAPSISAAAIDGEPGVFLMVQGQLGANTLAVTRELEKALQELAPLLAAEAVELKSRMFRPANFIETAIENVRQDLLVGAALVVVVLFLFLFNSRIAFICATAIPVSLLTAVIVLDLFGVGVNIMVLGGLAIALGEVVDDAIIDSENIFRRLRLNRLAANPASVQEVVLNASVEVRSSVVYATFIVALVFVPLLTLSGVAGRLFAPLGLAYILAILASLVVALTLTPALCSLLLAQRELKPEDPPAVAWLKPRYVALLRRVESHPGLIGTAAFVLMTLGIGVLGLLSGEFIPPLREGHYIIHMTAVPGTAEAESVRIGERVTKALLAIDGVQSVAQWVGRAPGGADTFGSHYSEFEVEIGTVEGEAQARILREIREALSGRRQGGFAGVTFAVNTFLTERIEETLTGFAAPLVVTLYGADLDALDRDAQAVAGVIAAIPGARDVQLQAPPGTAELSIRLRPDRLAGLGLQPAQVLQAIQAAYAGARVGQIYQGSRAVDVVVLLESDARNSIARLGSLQVRTADGRMVRLGDVADMSVGAGRYKILHAGGRRSQTVTAGIGARDIEAFEEDARRRIARQVKLAPGNYAVFGGTAQARAEARRSLIVHAAFAGVGVLVLLYLAFGNLNNLAVTLLNLPFALIGGVCAVLLTGGWLSLGSLVGFVTLFGITLRNSIMLVSHYQRLVAIEAQRWNAATALQGAAERLPSILMTALVTALALLPLALGTGEPGREIEGPMAIVIVGGLVTSTALNLLILPTILLRFGRFEPQAR
ncbi:MAG TPA: efflux RND transporter permease subunit [Burkholderiales bacterium]|nr:efflux RND transporter permease subunit [Burkholderiales bacterium]